MRGKAAGGRAAQTQPGSGKLACLNGEAELSTSLSRLARACWRGGRGYVLHRRVVWQLV